MMKNLANKEYLYHDGEDFIVFNIIDINLDKREVTVAVTNRGKISVQTFDLLDNYYFEYGVMADKIYIEDFEEALI